MDIHTLAQKFRIRPQRVMAIIALKEKLEEKYEAGELDREATEKMVEEVDRARGTSVCSVSCTWF